MGAPDEIVDLCEARLGSVLDGWTLHRVVGIGGMGAVFEAENVESGVIGALKLLHADYAHQESIRSRFLRESKIANAVEHDGSVKVLGQGTTEDDVPYLVMELLKGETVEDILERTPTLPLSQALGVADGVLAVLAAAHEKGIVHRDIKPENVFITKNRKLKLLDFGIARLRDSADVKKTSTGSLMGTPTYMPPEQALGRMSDIGPHTDVWAVGAMIFAFLSGQTVHDGETAGEVLVAAATQPARSLAEVVPDAPLELVMIVDQALAYDTKDRIPNCIEFRSKLKAFMRARKKARGGMTTGGRGKAVGAPSGPLIDPSSARSVAPRPLSARERIMGLVRGLHVVGLDKKGLAATAKLWDVIDSTLTNRIQFGPDHPQAEARFEHARNYLRDILREFPDGVVWEVNPYAFEAGGHSIWEPRDQLDWVPYRAFASGIRVLGFCGNLNEEEFSEFLDMLTLDPNSDMAPEDDLVTLLWERRFEGIFYREVDTFSEGDQAEREAFESQRRELIAFVNAKGDQGLSEDMRRAPAAAAGDLQADMLEATGAETARARAVAEGLGASGGQAPAQAAQMVELDEATLAVVRAQMDRGSRSTGDRFIFTAAHAYLWALSSGHREAVTMALRSTVEGLAQLSAPMALGFAYDVCRQVRVKDRERSISYRAQLSSELLSAKVLQAAQAQLTGKAEHDDLIRDSIAKVLQMVDQTSVNAVVEVLPLFRPGSVLDALMEYLSRWGRGREVELGQLVHRLSPRVGIGLLRAIVAIGSPAARAVIEDCTQAGAPLIRVEALAHLDEETGGNRFIKELGKLLNAEDEEVRLTTLSIVKQYKMERATPVVVERIANAKSFGKLSASERRATFLCLATLKPSRAVSAAQEILDNRRVIPTPWHEETRQICCEVIELHGSSIQLDATLQALIDQRIGVAAPTKRAANKALLVVKERRRTAREASS